ncbi:MAG: DMT family transporter [Myxococcales bacterium]
MRDRTRGALGTALAILYVFLWASAFVPSRVVSTSAPPLWILVVRFFLAGGLLLAGARAAGIRFPSGLRTWAELALLGLCGNALYLGLTYLALRHLSSGMGAIIASTNPLLLALLAPRLLGEKLTLRKLIGMVLGFSGVLIAMHARAGTQAARAQDVLLTLGAVVASVASTIVFKRMRGRPHPLMINAVQLACAGLFVLPAAILLEGPPHLVFTPRIGLALLWLVAVMSIGASLLWFWLLRHGDASRVSAFYFLTPVFGLLLGAVLLHERIAPLDLIGLAVIVLGLTLVTRDPASGGPRAQRAGTPDPAGEGRGP